MVARRALSDEAGQSLLLGGQVLVDGGFLVGGDHVRHRGPGREDDRGDRLKVGEGREGVFRCGFLVEEVVEAGLQIREVLRQGRRRRVGELVESVAADHAGPPDLGVAAAGGRVETFQSGVADQEEGTGPAPVECEAGRPVAAGALVSQEHAVLDAGEAGGQSPATAPGAAVPLLDGRAVAGQAMRAVAAERGQDPRRGDLAGLGQLARRTGQAQRVGHRRESAGQWMQGQLVDGLRGGPDVPMRVARA
ncbi:hypothetical protein QBC98_007739 [Kitasatospora acidiphila]